MPDYPKAKMGGTEIMQGYGPAPCLSCKHLREAANPENRKSYAVCAWPFPEFDLPWALSGSVKHYVEGARNIEKHENYRWLTFLDLHGGGGEVVYPRSCKVWEPK